jgi:hypothetical protein
VLVAVASRGGGSTYDLVLKPLFALGVPLIIVSNLNVATAAYLLLNV